MNGYNGDSWRWDLECHAEPSYVSVLVIEPPEERDPPEDAQYVPFGFGVRPETDDGWQGNPS